MSVKPRRAGLITALAVALVSGLLAGAQAGPRAAAASQPPGGVTLDLFGGLHPFGGVTVDTAGAPYWPGWDIARSAVVLPDGSGGWTLDGFGGIHDWGSAPAIATPAYWPGWDIARTLVVLPDERSGYVLDGFGYLHPFGSAPALSGQPYWPGWDIARGFDVDLDSSGNVIGGWEMDGFGGLHAVGSAPPIADPATYYPGRDVWQRFHYTPQYTYVVGRWGVTGGTGAISPGWSGYSDWGAWNAVRDIVLINPNQSPPMMQPVSAEAYAQWTFAINPTGVAARPQCGVPVSAVRPGKVILISLGCQELSAYQDGVLVTDTLVTTGRPALPTLPGWTTVLGHNHPFLMVSPWPSWSIYYYYPSWVQYVTWFRSGGYGIHDAYWEPDSALGPGSEYGPYASHGCVHVPLNLAQLIYNWAPDGTPVGVF